MWTPKRIPAIWRRPGMVVGAIIVLVVVVVAVAAPILAPADPNDGDIMLRLQPPVWLGGQTGLMGTDQLGRDVLSRAIYGARVSLIVGSVSVLLAGSLGLVLGLISGYAGRQVDNIIMRLTDIQMAFPFILLALAIIAILGPGIRNMIIVFAVTDWTIYARTIRGAVLSIREKEFVEAARGLGGGHGRIIIRHILPSVTSPLIVISSFEIAKIIIYEASLSFLGLGVPQAIPSWGQMLADGREYIQTAWWVSTFPGLPLMITVLGINFIGDGLRDALDPRSGQVGL
jgi:peptide/nickel transport system permease protein